MKMNRIFRYLILLYLVLVAGSQDDCPLKCVCKRSAQREGPDWVKIRCGDKEKINNLEELDLFNIATEIVQLNLSNNYLSMFLPKVQLVALQKLDISKNQLTILQNDQFIEVPNLRRLDISGNNIKHIEMLAFNSLQHLERLKLNLNQITTIGKGTFNPLSSLKQLDISNNPLTCDCELLWLLDWSVKASVKLISNPKCNSPQMFKGISLRKLKVGVDIHCKSPAGNQDMPIIDLTPAQNQVVFEGDTLKLNCQAPSILDAFDSVDSHMSPHLEWTWLDSNPKHHFGNISIEDRFLPEHGLMKSSLTIPNLERNHTGIWNCLMVSNQGNHSKGITVIVISDDTRYCPTEVTSNNKGSYTWPRTIVNNTVTMPCESLQLNGDTALQKASYFCSLEGQWEHLNTSNCPYTSDTTKILEQFSKVNLSLTKANIFESALHFKNHTADIKMFKDVMDLVYVARTIENYLYFLEFEKELGPTLMDILDRLMELPVAYLSEANLEDGSCRRMVNAVETIARYAPSSFHKTNIATEQFPVKQDGFAGMICTWYANTANNPDRLFYCVTTNRSSLMGMQDKVIESSVQVQHTLFHQLDEQEVVLAHSVQHILITMYKNNKFFPVELDRLTKEDVTSPVVGVKLVNVSAANLSDPVYVMMRNPSAAMLEAKVPTPVWWDSSLNSNKGSWSTNGCRLKDEVQDNLVFVCKHLGYYSLMQDITYLNSVQVGAKFKFSHPAIYVGSFILIVSLLVAIMTYLLNYNSIQMPKKAKHALINVWIAISLLCFMYVFGVYQTENVKLCQTIGLILHYLTLCSLLWMCVGVNYMYKRLTKNDVTELQDDELPSDQPIQKPILGLYLVGWGIALIICGISGAVNMKEYATHSHCFLNSVPSLSALFIPLFILLTFLFVFFLLIRCAIYNVDTNGHLSEGTQATENVDLDLLEPNFPNTDARSIRSNSTKTASSEVEDSEHAPSAQLKAYIVFLIIYLLTWTSCALATMHPFKLFSYEEDIFSIAFAVFATTLGAFTLFFYCVARNDVRTQWVIFTRLLKRKNVCFRSRNVSDASPNVTQIQIHHAINNPLQDIQQQVNSRSSSRSSSHTKTNSHTSNVLKAAADLNGSAYSDACGAKINNVNLIVLHRQQYRMPHVVPNLIENPTSSAEMFYNPHQSTVARKFFKKQKRHMMKRNNLTSTMPRDVNSDNASSVLSCPKQNKGNSNLNRNIFGNNSKVNNTNIHVEQVRKSKLRNPNILSDSCEEYEGVNVIPVEKLVMNAEHLRKRDMAKHRSKKKQNVPSKEPVRENNMRSVSQQCTLEYSSETISDSILDKTSPDKCLPIEDSFKLESGVSVRRPNSPALTDDSHYCKIASVPKEKIAHENYYQNELLVDKFQKYENWGESSSIIDSAASSRSVPRIYVNPSHDLSFQKPVQSRTSSVSASELDELYQQIRRGPKLKHGHSRKHNCKFIRPRAPCLSDSEINTYVNAKYRRRAAHSDDNISDKIETTV